MLITFEGPEGGGKSTQIALLAESLRKQGLIVAKLREPGGTEISEQIRSVIHDLKNHKMAARAELLLYEAARAQIVDEMIRPYLEDGAIVLLDRFIDSSRAYQGGGRGISDEAVDWLNNFATDGLKPDLTLLLMVDAEEGLIRRRDKGEEMNRMDSQSLEFHRRVQEKYLKMASEDDRWAVIDASKSVEEIQNEIGMVVASRLLENGVIEGSMPRVEKEN